MKKSLIVLVFVGALIGCKQKEKQQIAELNHRVENLKAESAAKDSAINNFFRVLNDIESNLTLIMQKEQVIAKNAALGNEMQQGARERIQDDINTINELMTLNRSAISKLQNQLKGANLKINEFEKRMISTQNLLDKRDNEVEQLKHQLTTLDFSLEQLNITLDTLSIAKQQLERRYDEQVADMNTAWYAFGSRRELLENNVIERAGGFLGIGKTTKLKENFNTSYFTKIDITQTQSIPFFTSDASLVTTHPSNSYEIIINERGIVEEIYIFNPQLFWSTSKYLVIIVD